MMENSAEESGSGSGGDSDMESVMTTPGFRHITQTPDACEDISCSAPNTVYTADIDTFTMQTLEVSYNSCIFLYIPVRASNIYWLLTLMGMLRMQILIL